MNSNSRTLSIRLGPAEWQRHTQPRESGSGLTLLGSIRHGAAIGALAVTQDGQFVQLNGDFETRLPRAPTRKALLKAQAAMGSLEPPRPAPTRHGSAPTTIVRRSRLEPAQKEKPTLPAPPPPTPSAVTAPMAAGGRIAAASSGPFPSQPQLKSMTLRELREQLALVEAQIEQLRGAERRAAIAKVRAWMADHGITTAEIFSTANASRRLRQRSTGVE